MVIRSHTINAKISKICYNPEYEIWKFDIKLDVDVNNHFKYISEWEYELKGSKLIDMDNEYIKLKEGDEHDFEEISEEMFNLERDFIETRLLPAMKQFIEKNKNNIKNGIL